MGIVSVGQGDMADVLLTMPLEETGTPSRRMGMNGLTVLPCVRSITDHRNLLYYCAMQHTRSIIGTAEMPKGGAL